MLTASPQMINDWVTDHTRHGEEIPPLRIVYYIYKRFAPGGHAEREALYAHIKNPLVCSRAVAVLSLIHI